MYVRLLYWRDALNRLRCIGGYIDFVLEGCMSLYVRHPFVLYWRDSLNRLHCCIGGYIDFVLEGCMSLYIRLLYWRDFSIGYWVHRLCIGRMHPFVLYWRDASLNRLHCCIGGYIDFVLEGCMSLYVRLLYWRDFSIGYWVHRLCIGRMHPFVLYWRDASLNRLHCCIGGYIDFVLEGCISLYVRLLYWRDASLNRLHCCIGGYIDFVLEGCIPLYVRLLY